MRYALLALLIASPAAAEVRDADEKMVEGCQFVGMVDVQGRQSLPNARERGREQAAEMGATHIVWQSPSALGLGLMLSGRAYRC